MSYSPLGAQLVGFHHFNPLEFTHGRHVQPGDGHWPTPGMHRVAAPSTTMSMGEPYATQYAVSSHPIYMVGHTALGAWQRVT